MDCTVVGLLAGVPLVVAALALSRPISARRRDVAVLTLVCLFALVLGGVGIYQGNGRDLRYETRADTAFYWMLAWGAVSWTLMLVLVFTWENER